jgi:hypothetical protein
MATISISALGPTLTEQCETFGLVSTGMPLERADKICHAITLCYIQGVLTDSETDRARKRLLKAMKLAKARGEA